MPSAAPGTFSVTRACVMLSGVPNLVRLRYGKINDGSMRFSHLTRAQAPPEVAGFTSGRSV